ncbi:MAG: hypothetical protein NVSMB56_12680 [Pyrinomonadaceae bacterium]
MSHYFFDSSAIVKLHINETGTAWVKSLVDLSVGNQIYVARIVGAEVVSAITRRARAGSLSATDTAIALADFRYDLSSRYLIIEIDTMLISSAMKLVERYALRGYDTVQIAAMLQLYNQRFALGLSVPTLISADIALNDAAMIEGLNVEDPNNH